MTDQHDRKDIRYCANSGYWNGNECVIGDEEEQAAYEDAVCDDPTDTQKYSDVCGGSSNKQVDEKRIQQNTAMQMADYYNITNRRLISSRYRTQDN